MPTAGSHPSYRLQRQRPVFPEARQVQKAIEALVIPQHCPAERQAGCEVYNSVQRDQTQHIHYVRPSERRRWLVNSFRSHRCSDARGRASRIYWTDLVDTVANAVQ